MNMLGLVAVLAGGCIAIQAAMNARLGVYLHSATLATSFAFFTSFILMTLLIILGQLKSTSNIFEHVNLSIIPWYFWFSCVLSVLGVGALYWLIPKMGAGMMMSYALTGQIMIAMFISHFGLFESPQKLLNVTKMSGSICLIIGIILINKD